MSKTRRARRKYNGNINGPLEYRTNLGLPEEEGLVRSSVWLPSSRGLPLFGNSAPVVGLREAFTFPVRQALHDALQARDAGSIGLDWTDYHRMRAKDVAGMPMRTYSLNMSSEMWVHLDLLGGVPWLMAFIQTYTRLASGQTEVLPFQTPVIGTPRGSAAGLRQALGVKGTILPPKSLRSFGVEPEVWFPNPIWQAYYAIGAGHWVAGVYGPLAELARERGGYNPILPPVGERAMTETHLFYGAADKIRERPPRDDGPGFFRAIARRDGYRSRVLRLPGNLMSAIRIDGWSTFAARIWEAYSTALEEQAAGAHRPWPTQYGPHPSKPPASMRPAQPVATIAQLTADGPWRGGEGGEAAEVDISEVDISEWA